MKPAQWVVALVVLVTTVFVITFAMNYVNVSNEGDGGTPPGGEGQVGESLRLTFAATKVPDDGTETIDEELEETGGYDFWFVNENDRPLDVGAIEKSCRCSSVLVSVLPAEEWKRRLALRRGSEVAWLSEGPLESLACLAALEKEARQSGAESAATTTEVSDHTSATVPAGGIGWVRMTWKGEQPGRRLLSARIWMGNPGNTLSLEARVRYHEPLKVATADRHKAIGKALYPEQLPYSDSLLCWSSTRKALDVRVTPLGVTAGEDPFVIGSPEPLTAEECLALERKLQGTEDQSMVLCGYRIPITLRGKTAEGKSLLDLGLVRRWMEVKAVDTEAEPIQVSLEAQILGEVHVGSSSDPGRLVLTPFQRSKGSAARRITLWSDNPQVELEVDEERTAEYLRAELVGKPAAGAQGRRVWQLEVSVPPGQASGRFPRPEDPRYRDSAVYLKIQGVGARSLRVPVLGIADIN